MPGKIIYTREQLKQTRDALENGCLTHHALVAHVGGWSKERSRRQIESLIESALKGTKAVLYSHVPAPSPKGSFSSWAPEQRHEIHRIASMGILDVAQILNVLGNAWCQVSHKFARKELCSFIRKAFQHEVTQDAAEAKEESGVEPLAKRMRTEEAAPPLATGPPAPRERTIAVCTAPGISRGEAEASSTLALSLAAKSKLNVDVFDRTVQVSMIGESCELRLLSPTRLELVVDGERGEVSLPTPVQKLLRERAPQGGARRFLFAHQ